MQHPAQRFGGTDREGAFFDHDFVAVGMFDNAPGSILKILQVGCLAGPGAKSFGRRVDADENDVGRLDRRRNIGRVE
ncbi:hypothetical protein SDC9_174438 [bioreactor metagenome]|uniref:Uncharacterized protein n=1 Tax=bioreactor metagenome TaxID=1076179 RepID=A0A645GJ62_9ZZZZ